LGKVYASRSNQNRGAISGSRAKRKKKSARDRFIPIPAKLVWKIKDRMREWNAQPQDLVFPNGAGKPNGNFLRRFKAIPNKAGIKGAELH